MFCQPRPLVGIDLQDVLERADGVAGAAGLAVGDAEGVQRLDVVARQTLEKLDGALGVARFRTGTRPASPARRDA